MIQLFYIELLLFSCVFQPCLVAELNYPTSVFLLVAERVAAGCQAFGVFAKALRFGFEVQHLEAGV